MARREGGSELITGTYEHAADVLEHFRPVIHAIAAAGGPSCEVVLHNLDGADVDLGHTIMAIENGDVTGREVGGPSTSFGLDVIRNPQQDHDRFGYRAFTSDGRALRCSSVYFRNRAGNIVAALCINVDLSGIEQAKSLLETALAGATDQDARPDEPQEHFGHDLVSVMDAMIAEAIHDVGKPVAQMTRADKIGVLRRLDGQGVTQMRKSVETVATQLGISRVTAYSYLDEARRD